MQADEAYVSRNGILQPNGGAGEIRRAASGIVYQEGTAGEMHRRELCGQHAAARLQEPAHTYPQDVPRYRPEGQMLHGVVLRIQAAPDMQREGRNAELHDNAWRH